MAWTDPPRTWVTGETPTAAIFNAHLRDQLIAAFPSSTGPVWKDWTPTYGNLTVGNGVVRARYQQVGKSVFLRYILTFGTTSSISGGITLTPPVTISSDYTTDEVFGNCLFRDAGTAVHAGHSRFNSANAISVEAFDASATHLTVVPLSSTIPMTWTTNDVLTFNAFYEAA